MTNTHPTTDITVRHGLPTIIPPLTRPKPPRHQPDTPVNKKFATQKTQPKKRRTKTTSDPPPPAEPPLGENSHGPTTPS